VAEGQEYEYEYEYQQQQQDKGEEKEEEEKGQPEERHRLGTENRPIENTNIFQATYEQSGLFFCSAVRDSTIFFVLEKPGTTRG